jgi:hypothetical protein
MSSQLFIQQSIVAEENLIRLALEAEKFINSSAKLKDIVNDCLVSSSLLRQARETFDVNNPQAHFATDEGIDKLLYALNEEALNIDDDRFGLPLNLGDGSDEVLLRRIVRDWLATLNQPPATSN